MNSPDGGTLRPLPLKESPLYLGLPSLVAARWIGSVVRLRYMPDYGIWRVTGMCEREWLEILPLEDSGKQLARLSGNGMLYVRARDMIREPTQQEKLL